MVGFGDNAGSGFPAILDTWKKSGWIAPELTEDTILNQVKLILKTLPMSNQLSDDLFESAESAEKSAESAEKSIESVNTECDDLSFRHKQILSFMDEGIEYKTEEIALCIGLKGARTRQLLNELVSIGKLERTSATKNRKYIKK